MKDLTDGSIAKNIVQMAVPIAAGMFFQTLYFLIDLYFVAGLGPASIAGVGAAGNVQSLGSGAAMVLAGTRYLHWFLPSLALQFALVAMGSALRGTGIVQPTMVVQVLTVMLNAVLAPVLIAGWGTGHAMGVAGAGLASSLSVGMGVVLLAAYFLRLEKYVAFDAGALRPQPAVWGRLLRIGLPAGGEFALVFLYMAVIYWIIRRFGPDAQAGFGIGQRVMQSMFLPAMAVAFATAPIVGQNFAAGKFARVRETFVMVISWNFLASGFVFTCSAVFQGLGHTLPAVLSSASRIVSFVAPALWLAAAPRFQLLQLWYVSVASVTLQAILSLWLVRGEFRRRAPVPSASHA